VTCGRRERIGEKLRARQPGGLSTITTKKHPGLVQHLRRPTTVRDEVRYEVHFLTVVFHGRGNRGGLPKTLLLPPKAPLDRPGQDARQFRPQFAAKVLITLLLRDGNVERHQTDSVPNRVVRSRICLWLASMNSLKAGSNSKGFRSS